MDLGVDPVHAPCWNHLTGVWGRAPFSGTATMLPPDVSMERWRAGFIPETREHGHQSCESRELHTFDKTGSLGTFLTKFQHMASYLCWDDEDMFHHLCVSLEGAVGQVFWDTGLHTTTTNIVCLLQTWFGTQLEAPMYMLCRL